ncbi:hypothetical protein [Escherichia coli]|uniref:hypothetical protein n=1 Tax=Escherichia coli TaxID=562 RepID=UPI003F459626
MNELSTEVKAQEIHENAQFWHNRAEHNLYKFFLEVKKIRDNRYYKELGYSNFEDYCLNSWNIKRGTMDERIQIAETFSESDFNRYSGQLGHKKTLLLTTMSEPQREQTLNEGVPTEQGYKAYDKATQKEIAAYKRNSEEMERKAKEYEKQLKQRDEQNAQLQSQVEQAQRSEEIAKKQLEDAESREPEVIERYMEPEDYQETKNALVQSRQQQKLIEQRNEKLEKDIKEMEQRRDEVSEKSQKYDELNKAINDMNAKLNDGQQRLKAQKEIYDLVKGSEKVIREVAPLCYLAFSKDIIDNDYARKPIEKIIEDLTDMANRLRKQLKKGEVIDV